MKNTQSIYKVFVHEQDWERPWFCIEKREVNSWWWAKFLFRELEAGVDSPYQPRNHVYLVIPNGRGDK